MWAAVAALVHLKCPTSLFLHFYTSVFLLLSSSSLCRSERKEAGIRNGLQSVSSLLSLYLRRTHILHR